MNYKETLYFIAKCLTISLGDKNKREIENQLKSDTIDWDVVVKVSTSHYVFPAIYCNFKRADFLKYLPSDLFDYMRYITNLNRNRNKQIIEQAHDLNNILLANNITPIFLKGTGNLLSGIYVDPAERMVGDIDILVSEKEFSSTIKILLDNSYMEEENQSKYSKGNRHYTRLVNKEYIAAVEIHTELLIKKYTYEFNYNFVKKDCLVANGVTCLSYANKLNLSIISNQINDSGFYFKTIALRNAYDVFLLSKKTNAKNAVSTLDKLSYPLNCFLAACYEVFNKIECLEYNKTKKTASYLNVFSNQLTYTNKAKKRYKRIKRYITLKYRLNIIYKSIIYKVYRVWLFKKLTSLAFYKRSLLKKMKNNF